MVRYTLAFKPAIGLYGQHDPSAVLFEDGTPVFGIEEERLTRQKHAPETFPTNAIAACLEHRDLELADIDRILLPYDPTLRSQIRGHYVTDALRAPGLTRKLSALEQTAVDELTSRLAPTSRVERHLEEIDTPVPPIETLSHHRCHAASAFHPSGFEDALVLTIDAKGEYDSTVVWRGSEDGLTRIHTHEHPNSLGLFYAIITEYLGYRMFNGEGKVMGLAPYGQYNPEIERTLREFVDVGPDYDVTDLTKRWGTGYGVEQLEAAFDRPRTDSPGEFDQWEKDLAYTAQRLLEEIVCELVREYVPQVGSTRVALAGGVVLNCKLNKAIRELPIVDDTFVQPSHTMLAWRSVLAGQHSVRPQSTRSSQSTSGPSTMPTKSNSDSRRTKSPIRNRTTSSATSPNVSQRGRLSAGSRDGRNWGRERWGRGASSPIRVLLPHATVPTDSSNTARSGVRSRHRCSRRALTRTSSMASQRRL